MSLGRPQGLESILVDSAGSIGGGVARWVVLLGFTRSRYSLPKLRRRPSPPVLQEIGYVGCDTRSQGLPRSSLPGD